MLQVQLEEHLSITKLLQNWQHAILIPFRKGNENEWEDQKEGSNRDIKKGEEDVDMKRQKTKQKRREEDGKERR